MKKLLLGNEAIARGAYEAGVRVSSAYPGTPSTEINENVATYPEIYSEWAPNEKVAVEVALGAAVSGARSLACMKHVGLNVAADPFFTATYTGVNAGMVVVVADDPGMHSSQNEQDTRMLARASHAPVLDPSNSQECKDFLKLAYEISENTTLPSFSVSPPALHMQEPLLNSTNVLKFPFANTNVTSRNTFQCPQT